MLIRHPIAMPPRRFKILFAAAVACLAIAVLIFAGCSRVEIRTITATAYCGCGGCNGYTRGHWWLLHLDFWNRYYNYGHYKGEPYDPRTASGDRLRVPQPGLVSLDSLIHPWMVPFRAAFPWLWFQQDGTIAADTRYYSFDTRMYVPGYGWGRVEDVGGAIKGPDRIDLYHLTHGGANKWGRQTLEVRVKRP